MAESTGFTPYRPGQGVYARSAAGGVMLLLALFASVRLFQSIHTENEAAFRPLGMKVPYSALWAAGLFVVLGCVVFLFTFGLETGWKALDGKTRRIVDLLVDTESELAKVSWPSRDELTRSTTAVLVSIVLLGLFLFCVDYLVAFVMAVLKVLPR